MPLRPASSTQYGVWPRPRLLHIKWTAPRLPIYGSPRPFQSHAAEGAWLGWVAKERAAPGKCQQRAGGRAGGHGNGG